MKKEKKKLLEILGQKNSVLILRFLNEKNSAQYKDLNELVNSHTLNSMIPQLLRLGLIEHHVEKTRRKRRKWHSRREWYQITRVGAEILRIVEEMISILKMEPDLMQPRITICRRLKPHLQSYQNVSRIKK